MKVSGLTTVRTSRQTNNLENNTRVKRVAAFTRRGLTGAPSTKAIAFAAKDSQLPGGTATAGWHRSASVARIVNRRWFLAAHRGSGGWACTTGAHTVAIGFTRACESLHTELLRTTAAKAGIGVLARDDRSTRRLARSEHDTHSMVFPNTFWIRSIRVCRPSRPRPVPCV
jgi:hypothetical protein